MWPMLMLSLALGVIAPASQRAAATQAEVHLMTLLNNVRDSHALPPLGASIALGGPARRHTRAMAAAGHIFHTPRLHDVAPAWPVLGENVGMGATVDEVFTYFLQSPEHRANILDPSYRAAATGMVADAAGETVYVTLLFGG